MKTQILLLVLLNAFLFRVGDVIHAQDVLNGDRAFVNATVITMENQEILEHQTVVIREDRIHQIGLSDEIDIPDETEIIDAEGMYLIPGLAEMHGHIPPVNGSNELSDRYLEDVLFLYIACGVTTVRGMLGHPNQLELKEKVNNSEMTGPNLYLAGPSFSGGSIDSPEQAAERVRQQVEEGWDLLKIHPGLMLEEFKAVAEAAAEAEIAFAGHVPSDVGLKNAIELGIETIDHIDGYIDYMDAAENPVTDEQLDEVVQLTRENDVWIVPTQAVWETLIGAADYEALLQYEELKYMPPQIRQNWESFVQNRNESDPYHTPESAKVHAENRQILLKSLHDGGVKILMGTDAPQVFSVPGFSLRRELPLMDSAGLSPFEILKTGTRNVGEYFADKDEFGTITEGSRADLLLLSDNPLEDINVITDHQGVMVRGQWFSRSAIDEKLNEIEEAYN